MAKIILWLEGIVFVLLAFVYSYYPNKAMKINRYVREEIFNDRFLMTGSRKRALICLVIGLLFFIWGSR